MSNLIVKETTIDSLMTVIRKNTEPSVCIDTFGSLLREIKDKRVIKTVISDLNKFIEEFMTLVKDVDKMDTIRFKSKVLTDNFIQPERFFKLSKAVTISYIDLNAALNYLFTDNNPVTVKKFVLGKRNRLGNIVSDQYIYPTEPIYKAIMKIDSLDLSPITKENYLDYQEECRKVILLWNYLPAIVKAFIQTKRRDLDLDSNSKKFSKRTCNTNK